VSQCGKDKDSERRKSPWSFGYFLYFLCILETEDAAAEIAKDRVSCA